MVDHPTIKRLILSSTYNIAITGIRPEVEKKTAVRLLAELLKVTEEKVVLMLESPKFIVKTGVDLRASVKYEDALSECGFACVVEPDANTNDLRFDVPILSGEETPGSQTYHTAHRPDEAEQSNNVFSMFTKLFAGVSVAMFIYFALNTFGLTNLFKGDTSFDKASLIGKSTRADLDEFKNSGGLENRDESMWRGYMVTSYQVVYDDESGRLGMITIGLPGMELHGIKFASVKNLKESLARDCGDEWTQNEAQRMSNMHVASKDGMSCAIHLTETGVNPVQVILMMDPETLRGVKRQSNGSTSSNSAEERISQCVDQRVLEYRKHPGYEDAVIKMDIANEFEAECREKVGSTNR